MVMVPDADGGWTLRDGDAVVTHYGPGEVRFSVSWKAYCFADEAEHMAWANHSDDLTLAAILDRLVADLVARGVMDGRPEDDRVLARELVDGYIRFPTATN
jgi:hypothetical protein